MLSGGFCAVRPTRFVQPGRQQEKPYFLQAMNHSFDIDHAVLFGLQEAIFISNFQFWLRQNAANERNIRDGKPWTYNTHKAYVRQFPYMSEHQIRRVLESLVSQGILEKAKYNDNKYDHTLWYSFTDDFLAQNPLFDPAKKPDRKGSKPESHTDIKTDEMFDMFWKAYPKKVGKDAAAKAFAKRKPDDKLLKDILQAIELQKVSDQWQKDGGQYIPNPSTWLNQGRWMDEIAGTENQGSSVFAGYI